MSSRARPAVLVLADGVALLHFGVSAFIVFGGLLVWAGLAPLWLHLPVAAWGIWVHAADRTCPLTPLEQRLRARAGAPSYSGGFVARYLLPRSWRRADPRRRDRWVALGILAANVVIYGVTFG
jgi:hypothetical protein